MKSLGRIAYESTLRFKGQNWQKFGAWKNVPPEIQVVYDRIARDVEDEIFKRQQKRFKRISMRSCLTRHQLA